LSFPSNPADNATTLINGVNYIYSSANASWSPITSTNTLTYSSITATTSAITGTETVGTSVVTGSESVGGNETVTGNQLVLGNLGVGTITPSYRVHVVGTGGSGLISFGSTGTTTAYNEAFISNTGGSAYWGVESSSGGGIFTGSSAYAGVFGTGSSTPVQIATGNTVKMTVDSSGNVGIGTTSPTYKLDIFAGNLGTTSGNTVNLLEIYNGNGNANYLRIFQYRNTNGLYWDTSTTRIQNVTDVTNQSYIEFNPPNGSYSMAFGTGSPSIERVRIDSSGNVAIGTASPSGLARLEVKNSGAQNVAYFKNWSGTAASPTENADWPFPVLSLSSYGNFYKQTMLSFTLPNDGQSQGGGTYFTDDSIWNISLNGVTASGWDNNSNLTPSTVSSSNVGLQLMGPGNLRLGTQNAQAVVIRTSNTDRVTVNANGYVTIPNQPAFYADTGSSGTWTTYNCASNNANYVLIFTNGRTNVNGHYNTGSGFFTAPVAGRYFFGGQAYVQGGGYHRIQLIKSNGETVLTHTFIPNDMTISVSAIFYMNVGDTMALWATLYDQNIYMGAAHSFFYGYLIG